MDSVHRRKEVDDKWLWEDGDLNWYIIRSGYNFLQEYDQFFGRLWFK